MAKPGAHTFRRTRDDHSLETAADYVELIEELVAEHGEARGVDLSQRLGVSHVTVSKTIKRLVRGGYVRKRPYRGVFLTEKGKQLAKSSKERHELVLGLLRAIGVPANIAEIDAEGMEHHISPETLRAIKKFLKK